MKPRCNSEKSNTAQWVNGQPQPLNLQLQSAMFYPNAYLNFNHNGEYTKHYYNGAERIASRLGSSTQPTDATSNDRLNYRLMRAEEKFRENMQELVSEWHPVDLHGSVDLVALQPTGTATDIFYYHTNHLGSTAFVTDNNATITQGFLYAPFGEITTEYNANFGNNVLPKYSFNAKELDEETGMYYYEARYYKPPVFTSRDPMFEKYFWMTPYAYCANNPVKHVDPDGRKIVIVGEDGMQYVWKDDKLYYEFGGRSVLMDENKVGKSVRDVANSLKQINHKKEGHVVLNELSSSKTQYTITSKQKGNTDACFSPSDKTLYMNKHLGIGDISHEIFHAYQYENGRIGASIYKEVEAYVFQYMMDPDWENSGFESDNNDYVEAMKGIAEKFNSKDCNYAVSHFRKDSKANSNKTYKDYDYIPKGLHSGDSLIKKIQAK